MVDILFFAEGFVSLLESRQKEITIRAGRRPYTAGQKVVGRCAEGLDCDLEITKCTYHALKDVPSKDLKDDGFANAEHALAVLQQWYKDLTLDSIVSVIRFQLVGEW